jgi:cell division protein FtsL
MTRGETMSDFLNFLNTAELEALTKTHGITRVIAGNIIAARPFDTVEDCLNVHGMGKNLLARLQSNFEAGEKPSENSAMIQVDESPAPIEKHQPAQESPKEKKGSFFSRLGKAFLVFIRALFRLIAIAIVIGGIGAALYYGLPYFNQKVVVPIEKNRADIKQVEAEVKTLQSQIDETNSRLDTLDKSVAELEKAIEAQSESLTKLDEVQARLEEKIQTSQDETLLQLKHEVMFARALDMLGRARLYLAQSNFGLAREDVKSARELLGMLQVESKNTALDEAIKRLDMVLGNLPAFPVVAAGDLEIAWQILVSGESPATSTSEPTITPTVEVTLEVTPTIIPTTTPTTVPTLVPTLVVTPTAVP